jgi:2-dehydro-3-deoxyphosphogluconate aldolase/(4S)-4-hydroxy-2-oxoglutarate aldolase
MSDKILAALSQHRLVAIVRGISMDAADATAESLVAGGIRMLEVTMNTPGALGIIARWCERYEGRVHIGAGTVLNKAMAQQAVAAGAQFLISPNLDEDVIRYGAERGIEMWPGVLTPTEIVRACEAGATAVKVFPASIFGARYFKEIRGPLDHIPLIAVGGVDLENAADFLNAGAVAVGVGGNLVNKTLIESGQFEALTSLARQYVSAVKPAEQDEEVANRGLL